MLVLTATHLEYAVEKMDLAGPLDPNRAQTQHNRFYWLRFYPLTLLTLILSPLLATGILAKRVSTFDVTHNLSALAVYATLIEALVIAFAFYGRGFFQGHDCFREAMDTITRCRLRIGKTRYAVQ
jgi:hypothetical protein